MKIVRILFDFCPQGTLNCCFLDHRLNGLNGLCLFNLLHLCQKYL